MPSKNLSTALAAIANCEECALSGIARPLVTYSVMMEGVRFESNGSTLHYCKISARIHSLTEMSRDRRGQTELARPKSARPKWLRPKPLRPKRPDRIGQTEKSCSETGRSNGEYFAYQVGIISSYSNVIQKYQIVGFFM